MQRSPEAFLAVGQLVLLLTKEGWICETTTSSRDL